jgi:hypothetical protein
VRTGFWCGDLKERDDLEDLGVDGRTILNRPSGNWMGRNGLDLSGSG